MCGNNHWIMCNNSHPAITICLSSYLKQRYFSCAIDYYWEKRKIAPNYYLLPYTTGHMRVHTRTHTHTAHISRGHCLPQLSQKPASMNFATSRTVVSAASCTNQTTPCQLTYAAKGRRASWGTLKLHIFQSCRSAADGCRSTQDAGLLHPGVLVRAAQGGLWMAGLVCMMLTVWSSGYR